MAVTIRKKSGLIIPKSPTLILPNSIFGSTNNVQPEVKIIEKAIRNMLKSSMGVVGNTSIKRLLFVPVYRKHMGEKEIYRIYLKYRTRGTEKVINVNDIEASGVTLLEFLDFIIINGAKEIQNPDRALEFM